MEGFRVSLLFQVIFGDGKLPYISRIHTVDIGEDSCIFRYLKCSGENVELPKVPC